MKTEHIISLIYLLVILTWPLIVQSKQEQLPCSNQVNLVTDAKDMPVVLSSKELKRRSVRRVVPKFPVSCRCSGTVTVYLRISAKGEVECVKAIDGHPLLRSSVVDAVKQWTFKPTKHRDAAKSELGQLTFHFSVNGKVNH